MYKEAENAYEKVLEFDTNDPELEEELNKSRALQLQVNIQTIDQLNIRY
jgi:hypothetical protein